MMNSKFLRLICYILGFLTIALWLHKSAHAETGIASVYSYGHGTPRHSLTACGVRFDPGAMAAAHRKLPCDSLVRVRHGHHSAIVRITDRGPFRKGRIIDLTPAAARAVGLPGLGIVTVENLR